MKMLFAFIIIICLILIINADFCESTYSDLTSEPNLKNNYENNNVSTNNESKRGDVNMDGIIDIRDVVLVAQHILGIKPLPIDRLPFADINNDGIINVLDLVLLMNIVLGLAEADVNNSDADHPEPADPEKPSEPTLGPDPTDSVNIVNVQDFGTVADGKTCDQKAIQAAINHAHDNRLATVKIPAGKYLIKSAIKIPSGIALEGDQDLGSVLIQYGTDHLIIRNADLAAGNENITLKNLVIDGNGIIYKGFFSEGGIHFRNSEGIILKSVTIRNYYGQPQNGSSTAHAKHTVARFQHCKNVHIENSNFIDAGYYGLDFVEGGKDITIINSVFDGMHNTAVMFRGAADNESFVFCENILFEGNTVKNIGGSNLTPDGAFDIYQSGKDVKVINNYFYNCGETINGKHYGSAIRLTSAIGALVEDNTVIYDGISAFDAIRTSGREGFFGSEDIVISNNKVTMKNGAELRHRGISVIDQGPLSSNITINNNEIFIDETSYIRIAYYIGGINITLKDNTLIGCERVDTFMNISRARDSEEKGNQCIK